MKPVDVVIKSAEASASLVGTSDFVTLAKNTLSFTGDELVKHVRPEDRPCLFLPMELFAEGKYRQGALLALPGRAVLVWVVGAIRTTPHAVTLPAGEVLSLETSSEPARGIRTGREHLTIVTPTARWAIQVYANVFDGGRNILPFLGPALRGALTPEFEEAEPTATEERRADDVPEEPPAVTDHDTAPPDRRGPDESEVIDIDQPGTAVRQAYAQLAATAAVGKVSEPDETPMTKAEVMAFLDSFAEARRAQGDTFTAARVDGYWFYETGAAKTGLALWGEEDDWTFSAFSAARVKATPTLDLYRRVGTWRSTVPQTGCYLVEEDGEAAVMCEREIKSSQVFQGPTAWRLLRSLIDVVGDFAVLIHRELDPRHGIPFTLSADTGLAILLGWWEIQDPQITHFVQENG